MAGPGNGTGISSIRSYTFFRDGVIAAPGTYVANGPSDFIDPDGTPFLSKSIMLINDAGTDVWFSFDGVADAFRVRSGEPVTHDFRRARKVWFRGTAGAIYRFAAW